MKTKRLTKTEENARAFCKILSENNGGRVDVEWVRNRTWGSNPVIRRGTARLKCTSVSGCGYCKLSTALAECLRWLGKTEEEHNAIWQTGGCGVSSVQSVLAALGWTLTLTASGKTFDAFTLTRA